MHNPLRPFWSKIFSFDWKLGVFLILVVCVLRFVLVLKANSTGNYGALGIMMVLSAITPFIFLNKHGREKIGLVKPSRYSSLLLAFLAGLVVSYLLYLLGEGLYGTSYNNWYSYIGKSYKIPSVITDDEKLTLFVIMAVTGMIFSPIGEELFFRGIVHGSFQTSLGETKASLVESTTFSVVHLSHFGIVFIEDRWAFLLLPGILWMAGMFVTGLLFSFFKKKSGSLLGAIVCHAAFNLGMIYCIFYLL